jgi:CubicO group peptidase (beta-lactamase class C family)
LHLKLRLLGLAALTALVCLATPANATAYVAVADDEAKQVEAIFAAFVKAGQPGGTVIVTKDGKELYKGAFGLADIDKKTPLTPHSIFHLASAGKQFTALGIMMLAQEGKLKYDDPIGKYLPELAHFGPRMTIRTLLQHTSGIPDPYGDPDLYDKLVNRSTTPTNADTLAVLADAPIGATPGDKFVYSNAGYDMLGSLIEKLSGQPFDVFMQQRIFGPVGMKSTFSLPSERRDTDPNIAHSYTRSDKKIQAYDSDPMDLTVGSGSVYTTVEDMALYDKALSGETLIKQSTLAEAFKPTTLNDGSTSKYGFGWELDEYQGVTVVSHDGSWLAFRSAYIKFPSQNLTVVVLFNRDYDLPDDDPYGVGFAIADIFLEY